LQQVNVRRCRPLISTDKSLNQADNKTRRYFRYSVLFCLLNRRTSCVAINIAIRSAKIRRRFELKMWPIRSEGPSEAPPPLLITPAMFNRYERGGALFLRLLHPRSLFQGKASLPKGLSSPSPFSSDLCCH